MNQRCPHKIDCEGSDSPIANLTSETPEGQYWRAIDFCCNGAIKQYFSNLSYDDAIDGVQRLLVTSCPTCPPDTGDDLFTCDALCADGSSSVTASSTLSQEDACFKAQELANQIPCPPVAPPPPYHCNDTQICESINEDGTYTYIILPCTIYGSSVDEANAIALSRACERAKENRIKLGPITRCCCANEDYSSTIKVTSDEATLTYAVISGTVPPGITVGTGTTTNKTILVSGTPTTAGTYTFSLRAYDNSGNYSTRQYTIAVIEIATTSLPDFTVGTAYSAQLSATGGSGVYAWGIASGTLPDGLSLSATGLITGTPTNAAVGGSVTFAVVDTECEQLEAAAVKPKVQLSASSTTRNMRWLGWQSFDGSKRRFKKLEWTGYSEQWAITMLGATEFARYRYDYSGASEITAVGVQISRYAKNASSRAGTPDDSKDWVWGTVRGPDLDSVAKVKGYCYTPDPLSCQECDSATLTPVGDLSSNSTHDVPEWPEGTLFQATTATTLSCVSSSGYSSVVGHSLEYDSTGNEYRPVPPHGFPTMMFAGFISSWAILNVENDYSATLSEEYTDAEASANAQVYLSNSTTAENRPRNLTSASSLDWFRASTTSVDYTLNCTNLVPGRAYKAQVSLLCSDGTIVKPVWTFTAATSTHVINATIPTPPSYQTTMVKYPVITFD